MSAQASGIHLEQGSGLVPRRRQLQQIARPGRPVALRDASQFATQLWMRRWGFEPPPGPDARHDLMFDCDRRSCAPLADAPVRLALWAGRQPPRDQAFARLCASAEVLVLRSPLGPGQACPSATVFTGADFARGGSVELWRQGGRWRLRWAATERGARPWTAGPSTDGEG